MCSTYKLLDNIFKMLVIYPPYGDLKFDTPDYYNGQLFCCILLQAAIDAVTTGD